MSSHGMNNASLLTQSPDDVYVVVVRYWYAIVGIIGLSGNALTLIVTWCSKPKLKTVHIGILWLAIVDLLGCVALPIRYFYFFDVRKLSPTMCKVSIKIIFFLRLLSFYSLVPIAIERFKAVKNINNTGHMRNKTIFRMIALCLLSSLTVVGIFHLSDELGAYNPDSFQCQIVGSEERADSEEPAYVDYSAGSKLRMFIVVVLAVSVLSTIAIVIVLYFQITVLIRTCIGPQTAEHDQPQQMREPELPVPDLCPPTSNPQRLAEEGDNAISKQDQWWDVVLKDTHQLRDDEDEADSIDRNCVSVISMNDVPFCPADSYSTRTEYTQNNDIRPKEASVTLSDIEITNGVSQKRSFENQVPLQLPGAVFSSHVNNDHEVTEEELKRGKPTVLSLTTSPDIPPIPDLANNEQDNHDNELENRMFLYKKTTLMLFIATVMTIGTNVGLLVTPLADSEIVQGVFLELFPVQYAANPFIYSIVNVSFRNDCKIVFSRVSERMRSILRRQGVEN